VSLKEQLERERAQHLKWRRLAGKRNARAEEIVASIDEVREQRDAKREARRELEKEGREGWSEDRIQARREALADQAEGLEAELDRLLDRLDQVEEKAERAEGIRREHADRMERLRERRERVKAEREGRLTTHFHIAEFECRDGTSVPAAAREALEAWCQEYGEPLRERFGSVHINSGYRTESYNAQIDPPGEPNSVHIYDMHPGAVAADFCCERGTPSEWAGFLEARADGMGRYATFIHADNRCGIGWSRSRWDG
jgi:Peptidase M15